MSDVEYPMPREQARTPFTGGGAARSGDEMVAGGLLEGDAEGEPEAGVRFVAPAPPGSGVGVSGSASASDEPPLDERQ